MFKANLLNLSVVLRNSCPSSRPKKLCRIMSTSSKILKIEETPPSVSQSGLVIFLHGSGDTGHGAKEWVEFLMGPKAPFPHLKIIYPTAPVRPYTPLGGSPSNVWFDRKGIRPDVPEDLETVESMALEINKLIEMEVSNGIPIDRIVLGGFSMGGAMAFQIGYRYFPGLAGIFTLSSFLNHNSAVYQALEKRSSEPKTALPPLFMCHGERDDLVEMSWGEDTFNKLTSLGVTGEFHRFPNMLHELKKKELNMLYSWINSVVKEDKKS